MKRGWSHLRANGKKTSSFTHVERKKERIKGLGENPRKARPRRETKRERKRMTFSGRISSYLNSSCSGMHLFLFSLLSRSFFLSFYSPALFFLSRLRRPKLAAERNCFVVSGFYILILFVRKKNFPLNFFSGNFHAAEKKHFFFLGI